MKENQYECFPVHFQNLGIFFAKFSEEQMKPIKSEIDAIQKNFELYDSRKYNSQLVGNIKREYELSESKTHLKKLLDPLVKQYNKEYDYLRQFDILTKNVPVDLSSSWVNFQQKYEFNPMHSHDGIFTFVIWVKIPYDMENELAVSPGIDSTCNAAGMFQFQYLDMVGTIRTYNIPVDKSMENSAILFPSKFNHCVYPFFSSDGYRISVSGNFKFHVD